MNKLKIKDMEFVCFEHNVDLQADGTGTGKFKLAAPAITPNSELEQYVLTPEEGDTVILYEGDHYTVFTYVDVTDVQHDGNEKIVSIVFGTSLDSNDVQATLEKQKKDVEEGKAEVIKSSRRAK